MSKHQLEIRHLLVALLGRTSQVLTEPFYALWVKAGIRISEVSAIRLLSSACVRMIIAYSTARRSK